MKKLITASVVLAGVLATGAARADTVTAIEAFAGGNWFFMASGGNAGIGSNDTSANTIFSLADTAQANIWHNCALYNANNLGWGYGAYGGSNAAELYCATN